MRRINVQHHNTCAIILAAGRSSRMGQSKQLMEVGGRPCLECVIRTCLSLSFQSVRAVVGHDAFRIMNTISPSDERFGWILNESYESGMSTSFRKGLASVGYSDSCMIFMGDQ